MRTLISSFLLLVLLNVPAAAQSVLLPDDNDNNTAILPNLGLVPSQPPSAATTPQQTTIPTDKPSYQFRPDPSIPIAPEVQKKAVDNLEKNYQNILNENKDAVQKFESDYKQMVDSLDVTGPIQITPGGQVAEKANAEQSTIIEQLKQAQKGAKGRVPTNMELIAKQIDEQTRKTKEKPPIFLTEHKRPALDDSQFPNQLALMIADSYIWGESDVDLITRTLGYDRNQIPQNCQLRLDAVLTTSDTSLPYLGEVYGGKKASIKYQGLLTSVTLKPRAICYPPAKIPQSGRVITKSGDKYSIQLNDSTTCSVDRKATPKPYGVTIEYIGNGRSNCMFQ